MVHIVESEWHPDCIAHTTVYISASPCVVDKTSNIVRRTLLHFNPDHLKSDFIFELKK